MNEPWNTWWADISNILHYPLINLGDSSLNLASIIKLMVFSVLVLITEKYLRNLLRQRVLARTHLSLDLQYALSRFAGYCFIALGFFFVLKVIHLDLSALEHFRFR